MSFPIINNKHHKVKNGIFPSIGLKLTGRCRLGCPFCCEPDRNQEIYPVSNFISITNTLKDMGTERLCFTGGDPLLYDDLPLLLHHTKSLGFTNLLLTSDGRLLKERYQEIINFVDAIRFSIHSTGLQHDYLVNGTDAFSSIEEMIEILASHNVPSYVTTVVTKINFNYIFDIAEWCHKRRISQYFLFGLMKSGNGRDFHNEYGDVSSADIRKMVKALESTYSSYNMKIVYYDYESQAECILIYGDGRVVIDPHPKHPYQLEIGNIISDPVETIVANFMKDPKNLLGYEKHLNFEDPLSLKSH